MTAPVCLPCWYVLNPSTHPIRRRVPDAERCCKCGTWTSAGVYIDTGEGTT